jgi:hypothetical protein
MVRRRYWLKKVKEVFSYQYWKEDDTVKDKKERERKRGPKIEIDYEIKFRIQEAEDIKVDFNTDSVTRQLMKIVESRGRSGN